MKKMHITLVTLVIAIGLQAQTTEVIIADYETGPPASHWANGTGNIVENPSNVAPNESDKVFKYEKPASNYVQYAIYPTDLGIQRKDLVSIHFQVYNGGDATALEEYMIRVGRNEIHHDHDDVIWITGVSLVEGWNTISHTLEERDHTELVNRIEIYPNMQSTDAGTFYFDNILVVKKTDVLQPGDVEGVSISQTSVNLVVEQTIKLAATVHPDNAENKNVVWASSNESVATVVDGLVTAIVPGTATITVTTEEGDFTKESNITVSDDMDSIEYIIADYEGVIPNHWANGSGGTVNNPEQTPDNESAKVYRYAKPDGAWKQYLINTTSYNISRSALKSFSFQVYHGGDATEMTSYMLKVNTQNHEENADVDWQVELTLEPGWNTLTYLVAARDWSDRIASIEVYPLMESNDSGIFYFDNFILQTSEATVAVASVELNHATLELKIGDEELLIATVLPDNADNKEVTWSSSDESVASVDFWGMLTAVGEGTATITVTTEDGNLTATCVVTVIDPTNVERLVSTDFKVFPNPYRGGQLTIDLGERLNGEQTIKIYSISGVLVESYKTAGDTNKLVITPQIGAGIYLISIESNFNKAIQILIVK